MLDFFNRKKVVNTITINMLYALSKVSPGIIFRIINDTDFLTELAGLIQKFEYKHRRKEKPSSEYEEK